MDAHATELLQDFGVSEPGLFSDSNDRVANVHFHLRPPTGLLRRPLSRLRRVVLNPADPSPERRMRNDRHHLLDLPAQLFAVFDQRVSFPIVQSNAVG